MPLSTTRTFEETLKELEKIVGDLEHGEMPLETQLKAFERGVALSRDCIKQLEEVEQKVESLVEDANGSLTPRSFDPSVSKND